MTDFPLQSLYPRIQWGVFKDIFAVNVCSILHQQSCNFLHEGYRQDLLVVSNYHIYKSLPKGWRLGINGFLNPSLTSSEILLIYLFYYTISILFKIYHIKSINIITVNILNLWKSIFLSTFTTNNIYSYRIKTNTCTCIHYRDFVLNVLHVIYDNTLIRLWGKNVLL